MKHNYLKDKDLELLHYADNEMLTILVKYLTVGKNGKKRFTESLTNNPEYIAVNGNYNKVWKLIAAELQHYGGDSIANLVRGRGVPYKKILSHVCKKLKIKTDYSDETIKIEQALLAKLLQNSWDKMTESEQKALRKELGIDLSLTSGAALASIIAGIRLGGFMTYQVAMIVANAVAKALVGRGLVLAANAGLAKGIAIFAGPVGIVLTILLTVPALSGPALRVTLPAVIQIAAIRQQLLQNNKDIF